MSLYKKPVVLVNEELAEGVYAASGAAPSDPPVSGGAGSASVSNVALKSEGNIYYRVNTYTVTIQNSGSEELASWSVFVSVTSGVATEAKVDNGWLASASLSGSTITITPGGGGAIPGNGSIDVDVVVSYSSDSITVG